MQQKDTGIVLHTLKYNDTSLIIEMYTAHSGRKSFIASIPKSKKARVKTVLFQPLSLIEFESPEHSKGNLHRFKEVKPVSTFISLPYDPYKSAIALFLAEFLYRAIREEGENQSLYNYLTHSIEWLDHCEGGFANFHLVFLMRLSRFLGLYPNTETYSEGSYFDLLNAEFTPNPTFLHTYHINKEESAQFYQLMRMNYDTMHLFKMNRQQRTRCLELINDYYRLHLPDFPVLKSIEVLKGLFD